MELRITIPMCMVEIRNRKTLQSKVNKCKSDVKSATMPTAYQYSKIYFHDDMHCSKDMFYFFLTNLFCMRI